ncbi:MAG: hypothetical protein IJ875_03340, partial [Solobacterium sp.]|nr:hypothetical protein [Solobacterium sp.]
MRRRNGSSFIYWIFLFLIFSGGIGAVFPLFLIIGVVFAIMFAAVSTNRRQEDIRNTYYRRANSTTGNYYRANRQSKYSAAQLAKINVYLRSWFRTHKALPIGSNFELRIHGQRYASLASLDVYRENQLICSLNDFGRRYPDSYDEIIKELVKLSEQGKVEDIIDVEAKETNTAKEAAPKKKGAQTYMDEINALNEDIPDEGITNGLHETYALLKQIQTLEQKFPKSKDKLNRLYDYYLPILVRILKQYDNLQAAQTDPSYHETKEKLNRTITLINDAMKTIISSLTD